MKQRQKFTLKRTVWAFPALIFLGSLLAFAPNIWAVGTEVGTLIQNQATATYKDANNNSHTAQSNLGNIEVEQIYNASLDEDRQNKTGAAGQTVYFPHTLNNTGNGQDTYTITVDQVAGDTGDFALLEVYLDENNNGIPDPGETLVASAGSPGTITLDPDQQVSLVVGGTIPGGAVAGNTFDSTLTATTPNGAVDDLTAGNGVDGLEGTNQNKVTVTDGPILNVTKSSTYNHQNTFNDISDDTITYVITVTNTGQGTAYNVDYQDVLDLTKFSVTDVAHITGVSSNGNFMDTPSDPDEGSQNSNTVEGFSPLATNDANGDGTAGDFGVRGHDDVLPPNTTISFQYTAPLFDTLAAGVHIENEVTILSDNDDDGNTTDPGETLLSNKTIDTIPQTYGVTATDTGANGANGVNDGGDDDNTSNDKQFVDTAAAGDTVLFSNVITNTGNGDDIFEIKVPNAGEAGNTFPVGTVFTFWNATGDTALIDTNTNGAVDTGPLAAGASVNIMVKAKLPAGVFGAGPYEGTLTATSAGNSTIDDTAVEALAAITQPAVDLSNSSGKTVCESDGDPNANKHPYDPVTSPGPVDTLSGNIGANIPFYLCVQNDAGVSDSFQLSVGSSYDGATLGSLPAGWTVIFHDKDDNVITTTPALPPGGTYIFHVHIVVPADPTQALADFTSDYDGDGADETLDGNSDGDGDYPIFIQVKSNNTSAFDIKLDALDVNDKEDVTLITNQTGQIEPGGSITYNHTLRNEGNTEELLSISGANSLAGSGWGNSILVDTTGDGKPDKPFSALVAGDPVFYYRGDNTYASQPYGADPNYPAGDYIVLGPGEKLNFTAQVFAPSSSPDGTTDTLTVTATYNGGASTVNNTDLTTVQRGQLRLVKTVAIDAGCDGVADEAFLETASSKAQPGQCVVWQLVITNEGTAPASEVEINDSIPAYSAYVINSIVSGVGDATTAAAPAVTLNANTDADDNETHANGYFAKKVGNTITFYVGAGALQSKGGVLTPGSAASMRFRTRVE
ncbi:Conserved repeat domain protein [Candidatus Desulfarcum epimagneticum]|uniref:Conserved repeat domain protein n=1 Tax=uncultured Desulfobacteraceae bacterium TaxID=218296 RepID=A0A484HGM8_9BACT|nr:Conserved repeat domain protein [uncultured Desulfobacteraceae bacterium]